MYPRVILKLIGLILQDASAAAMILFTLIEALGGLARLGLEPNRPMGTTVAGLHAALCYHLHAFHTPHASLTLVVTDLSSTKGARHRS